MAPTTNVKRLIARGTERRTETKEGGRLNRMYVIAGVAVVVCLVLIQFSSDSGDEIVEPHQYKYEQPSGERKKSKYQRPGSQTKKNKYQGPRSGGTASGGSGAGGAGFCQQLCHAPATATTADLPRRHAARAVRGHRPARGNGGGGGGGGGGNGGGCGRSKSKSKSRARRR